MSADEVYSERIKRFINVIYTFVKLTESDCELLVHKIIIN